MMSKAVMQSELLNKLSGITGRKESDILIEAVERSQKDVRTVLDWLEIELKRRTGVIK